MQNCQNCGTVCQVDAVFCPNCGAALTMQNQQATGVSAGSPDPTVPVSPAVPESPASSPAPAPVAPATQNAAPSYTPPAGYPQQPPQQPYMQPVQQPYGQPGYNQPGYPYPMGQKRNSPIALGIVGIVFALLLPLVTYACSIPGLVIANQDIRRGFPAQNGRVLNIVALVLAVINSFLGIMLRLM